ncbi:MAG: DNA-binding protein, partial [Cyanobacteria bacterium J06553_1]
VARFQAVRNRNGGDFYKTQLARVSRQFVSALVESTLEGRTPYREALRLLNISKVETFHKIAEQLTVSV